MVLRLYIGGLMKDNDRSLERERRHALNQTSLRKTEIEWKHIIKAIIPEIPFSSRKHMTKHSNPPERRSVACKRFAQKQSLHRRNRISSEQLKFQTMANGNSGFSHLLMTLFLGRLYLSLYTTYRKLSMLVAKIAKHVSHKRHGSTRADSNLSQSARKKSLAWRICTLN